MPDFDVIIIGGGFAGVTVAREAGHAGLRCLILEARDRLGGRTWYSEFAGHPIELGGAWIHWLQPHVWSEMTRYGLEVTESPGNAAPEHCAWVTGGQLKTGDPAELESMLENGVNRFFEDARHALPRPYEPLFNPEIEKLDALSIRDRLDEMELSDEERDVLTGLWTSTCSTSCEEAGFATMLRWSALCQWSYSLLLEATSRYKFKDGTRSLIDAMISDGKPEVRISAPVERVDQDGEQVVITTYEGERISSSAAVITVPLNVLADVEFSPPLSPGKQSAASERQASRGVKVWALLRGDQEDFYGVTPGPAPLTWVQTDIRLDSGLLLVGFGPDANLLDMNDPIAVQSAVREFLPEAEVLAVRGHDWVADPYSQGLWPIFRPFQLTRYLKELQRPEGRLFFAGSETANGWNGFIDGAIESGLRVGHELLQRLGR